MSDSLLDRKTMKLTILLLLSATMWAQDMPAIQEHVTVSQCFERYEGCTLTDKNGKPGTSEEYWKNPNADWVFSRWTCSDKTMILQHDEQETPKYWCHPPETRHKACCIKTGPGDHAGCISEGHYIPSGECRGVEAQPATGKKERGWRNLWIGQKRDWVHDWDTEGH